MGPRKNKPIPEKICLGNELISDYNLVREKWTADFKQLYNLSVENENERLDFRESCLVRKRELETFDRIAANSNTFLNKSISEAEVLQAIPKLKINKSSGLDKIPNEVLKQAGIHSLLFKFFHYCFESGLAPSVWLCGIVCPIPKRADKDPYTPLN